MKLVVVTATTNPRRAEAVIQSWGEVYVVYVINGQADAVQAAAETTLVGHWITSKGYLGSVSAFRLGVDYALEHTDADIICCLHDDLEIQDPDWQKKVIRHFKKVPSCGLAGFGGAIGLGDADIYQKPYAPQQLARVGFRSNLTDAEVHGSRSLISEKVACLDGFSQIGRREFWEGGQQNGPIRASFANRPWTLLEDLGIVHHGYDSFLGCIAARYGWETWYLPIRCHHYGGRTAVGDSGYQQWATDRIAGGDHGFWEQAHRIGWEAFRDILPLRV